jgi:hypothetical protein
VLPPHPLLSLALSLVPLVPLALVPLPLLLSLAILLLS